jgi:hypothetical protein
MSKLVWCVIEQISPLPPALRRQWPSILLCAVSLLSTACTLRRGSSPLETAHDVLSWQMTAGDKPRPFHVQGRVTYSDTQFSAVVLQDGTGGIRVLCPSAMRPQDGSQVEVRGFVAGSGAPMPVSAQFMKILDSKAQMAQPKPFTFPGLESGSLDYQT